MTAIPVVAAGRRIRLQPTTVLAALVLLLWVVAAAFWPHLVSQDPGLQVPAERFRPPGAGHWLGTDQFGRDVFARMLAGSRPVLTVAPPATAVGVAAGAVIGLVTGTLRGWVDDIVMRILDAAMVFPVVIAAVLFVALLGHSTAVLVLVVAAAFVPIVARGIRAATLVERERPYVEAALLRGERPWPLMVREILPNVRGALLVEATSRLGDAIFAAATLSFLGLGQGPGSPEWGASVSENRVWLQLAPWTVLAPALAIGSLVIAVALLADVLRQRLDAR